MKKTELDLTSGNLFLKIIVFTLPLMMTTIFQILYTTIDLWTVAKFGEGSLSMSAIGSNTALINLLITVLASLATGANVCISVAKGANDKIRANNILHTAFLIAFFGGIIFGLFSYITCPFFLRLMDTPDIILYKAIDYLRIYFLGIPLLMIYNFGSQMLRALGDSKRPLYVLIISGITNVIFDFIFVYFFKMDVKGVAYATLISEALAAILIIVWFMINKNGFVRLEISKLKFNKKAFLDILKIGIPAGLQGLAFCIPNVLIQSSLYTIVDYSINGIAISQSEIVAGASSSAQIESYVFCMLDAFAVAVVSIVGQNYGAKNITNIKKAYWYCQAWMMIFASICMVVCGLFPFALLKIFISESDDIVAYNAMLAGRERLYILVFTYFLDGAMDISGNYLRGMRIANPPAIMTLIGCAGTRILFLTTLFKLPMFHTIYWLYAAFPISWILVNIVYIPVLTHYNKKVFNSIRYQLV